MRITRRRGGILATTTALALTLAACGSAEEEPAAEETDDGGTSEETEGTAPEDAEPITIGVHNGWDEGLVASYIWQHILEEQGYTVEMQSADPGVVFTGVAEGDYDLNFDTWLPTTHSTYWDEYGDQLESLGVWYQEAPLTIAVNEDAPIESLDELAENADAFDNRLVGIESGAGLTRITQDEVIPTYGLEEMEYVISSTPAMLAELESATDAGENIVVTLWRPHWAYAAYPVRDLEDPEGALGEPEEIHTIGTAGFSEEYPEVAEWIGNFTLTPEELLAAEEILVVENNREANEESIDQWLEDHPDFISGITGE